MNTSKNIKNTVAIVGLIVIAIVAAYVYKNSLSVSVVKRTPIVSTATPITTANYTCGDSLSINASYFTGEANVSASSSTPPTPTGYVQLSLNDGRSFTLNQTLSADGARYANSDESFVFWSKGTGALVTNTAVSKNYTSCIIVKPGTEGLHSVYIYQSTSTSFSIRYPDTFAKNVSYVYQELGPNKDIHGVQFTIDPKITSGTNLSKDSYISVENLPLQTGQTCKAKDFIDTGSLANKNDVVITNGDVEYSFASTTGAGAGNRYEETVYALPYSNPCIAVRYFIHYGVFENYPAGTIKEFNHSDIISIFDTIRHSLITN